MLVSYRSDIKAIEEYCSSLSQRGELNKLSFQSLETFLKEARSLAPGSPRVEKIVRDLAKAREDRIMECLGKPIVKDINRDFGEKISIVSWNVNGLRSRIVDSGTSQKAPRKGKDFVCRAVQSDSPLGELMHSPLVKADVICMQETKLATAMEGIFSEPVKECGWVTFWSSSACPNYSGVTTWVREGVAGGASHTVGFPDFILDSLSLPARDRLARYQSRREKAGSRKLKTGDCHPLVNGGRILTVTLPEAKLVIVNTYVPNTGRAGSTSIASVNALANARNEGYELPSSTAFEKSDMNLSGGSKPEVIDVREDWDQALGLYLRSLSEAHGSNSGWNIVWCGDLNVARELTDLHRGIPTAGRLLEARREVEFSPETKKARKKVKDLERLLRSGIFDDEHGGHSGFRVEERVGFEKILQISGLVDVFRELHPMDGKSWNRSLSDILGEGKFGSHAEIQKARNEGEEGLGFTYWDQQKVGARESNKGMRIDYFCVSPTLVDRVYMEVLPEVGYAATKSPSDHAPILLNVFPS